MLLSQLFGTTPTPTTSITPSPSPEMIVHRDTVYQLYSYHAQTPESLTLHSNLDQKQSSRTLAEEYQCRFLINGGFYDTDDNHLGWFINQSTSQDDRPSRFFDGYLSVASDSATIASQLRNNVLWGIQSGPLLVLDSKARPLNITNDEPRRRMVALLTSSDELWFLAIAEPQSSLGGPLLEETPEVVLAWASSRDLFVKTAINLDGGSASTFLSPSHYLREYNPIGSFICESP